MNENKATVKYSKGRTLNMGNFESTRFDVGVEVEVGGSKEEVKKAWKWAEKFVEDKLDEKEKEALL